MNDFAAFLETVFGYRVSDLGQFERAITHASVGRESYDRLEFLGDRVLAIIIARWLYERFPNEPEGQLSKRLNSLVSRETCAEVGRGLGIPARIRLGKQAREDRAAESDNVIGDVVEALIGALFLDTGLEAAERFVRAAWADYVDNQKRAPQHPKSALQELAADRSLPPPHYELVSRTGAHHAPTFRIRVSIRGGGEAEADGPSKQEAETAAAEALLEQMQ